MSSVGDQGHLREGTPEGQVGALGSRPTFQSGNVSLSNGFAGTREASGV